MSVVAKMVCHVVPDEDTITDQPQVVRLGAVWVPDDERTQPENAIFGTATPWGEITMGVANPEAKRFFTQGKKYYVHFTEAPD